VKVGLIPPRGLENLALRSKFHLALAIPDLMDRRAYGGMYKRAVKLGDFLILDNGIAEGLPCPMDRLRAYAEYVNANELVALDIMRDAQATVRVVRKYFAGDGVPPIPHMAVAQGEKMDDFKFCVNEFAGIKEIRTVGIPRHMLETLDAKACRIDLANWIDDKFPKRFSLHFLGTNPVWKMEVHHASKYASHVRSVDTSMPFNYALASEELATSERVITRPKRYFENDWSRSVDISIVRRNIVTLLGWANATDTRSRDAEEASARKVRNMSAV
jgi:hypothetical protein